MIVKCKTNLLVSVRADGREAPTGSGRDSSAPLSFLISGKSAGRLPAIFVESGLVSGSRIRAGDSTMALHIEREGASWHHS
jgi:hypothetical protein